MGLRVGVTRDDRFAEHKTGHSHPEHPRRIQEIYRMIDREFSGRLIQVKPEPAALQDVERIHTPAHVRRILKTAEIRMTSLAPDTPVSAGTHIAAWLAAGACLQGVDLLINRQCEAFFAAIRPPGHHALPDRSSGFCVFNNIAVAAAYAMECHNLKRVLIADWDVHHGNGLNDIFYESSRVFYYSTHDPMLYPYSGEPGQTGSGPGRGYTMNVPISREFTDDDMVYIYKNTLVPAIKGFKPEIIMVAAGFDAHGDDPIGRCSFSENLYARLTRLIMESAEAVPLFFALEGGYEPLALTRCVKNVLAELTADQGIYPEPDTVAAGKGSDKLVDKIKKIHVPLGVIA
jgi:acetoin utilization deacetylase AcuC-like enzyme